MDPEIRDLRKIIQSRKKGYRRKMVIYSIPILHYLMCPQQLMQLGIAFDKAKYHYVVEDRRIVVGVCDLTLLSFIISHKFNTIIYIFHRSNESL